MGLGLTIYNHSTADVIEIAKRAEELGFSSIWLAEHVMTPGDWSSEHPYVEPGNLATIRSENEFMNPLTAAAAILAATSRIKVATGIYILTLRHPLLAAHELMTAAAPAPERLLFGVGAGWLEEEFTALQIPFAGRGRRLDEEIDIVRRAIAGGMFEHHGDLYDFGPVQLCGGPLPVPILLGGTTAPALRRAAVRGDGWYAPAGRTLEEDVAAREQIETLRAEAGREDPYSYTVRLAPHDPKRLAVYEAAEFDEVVLHGGEIWGGDQATLAEKLLTLERTAVEFGVTPYERSTA